MTSANTPTGIEEQDNRESVHSVDVGDKRLHFSTPTPKALWRAQTLFSKEPATIRWLDAIPAGSRFLDVGANVGMYSIYAAKVRGCQVSAFEPESQNYALLQRNIALNELSDRIRAFCAALSDKYGTSTLYLSDLIAGGSCHSVGQSVDFTLRPREVTFTQACITMTIDRLVQSAAIPSPEFIKIDVDGFEQLVLKGGLETLKDSGLAGILIELNPAISEHVQAMQLLRAHGFEYDAEQVRAAERPSGPFKGFAEYVFGRSASAKRRPTPAPPPSLASAELAICNAIAIAPVLSDPFEHCIIDNVFPPDVLDRVRQLWPTEQELRPIEESGRVEVPEDQRGKRRVIFFNKDEFSRLESNRREFWRYTVWPLISNERFRSTLIEKFADIIKPRIADGTKVVVDALIVSDRTAYRIGPHTDSPRRLVSLLFYLPENSDQTVLGTSLYRPRKDGFTDEGGPHLPFEDFVREKTVDFIPNRLVLFPKTNRCFHGVEPVAIPDADRRLLIVDLQLVPPVDKDAPAESAAKLPVVPVLNGGNAYTRANPSPRYVELLQGYSHLHSHGEPFLKTAPEATFPGASLLPHIEAIRSLIERSGAHEVLDYGSGKGLQYRPMEVRIKGSPGRWDSIAEFWDVDNVTCYDPCHPPYSRLPQGKFDAVISTDVLEHCPEEDLPWIVDEIFSFATKFVFVTIAGYVAKKRLPNGENAHCTIRPMGWWQKLFEDTAARHPGVDWSGRYFGAGGNKEFSEFGPSVRR